MPLEAGSMHVVARFGEQRADLASDGLLQRADATAAAVRRMGSAGLSIGFFFF